MRSCSEAVRAPGRPLGFRELPERRGLPLLALVALTGTGGDLAFAAASHGQLSTVSATASLYPVPTIMLGAALGGRRPRRMHALGIMLALTGARLLGALST